MKSSTLPSYYDTQEAVKISEPPPPYSASLRCAGKRPSLKTTLLVIILFGLVVGFILYSTRPYPQIEIQIQTSAVAPRIAANETTSMQAPLATTHQTAGTDPTRAVTSEVTKEATTTQGPTTQATTTQGPTTQTTTTQGPTNQATTTAAPTAVPRTQAALTAGMAAVPVQATEIYFQGPYRIRFLTPMQQGNKQLQSPTSGSRFQWSFALTCINIALIETTLSADCRSKAGLYVRSWIDLNDYIANMDGELRWADKRTAPNFKGSSSDYRMDTEGGYTLHALCLTLQHSLVDCRISLDEGIENRDGYLTVRDDYTPSYHESEECTIYIPYTKICLI